MPCKVRPHSVEWIEFNPRRGTRPTKLNRSNWSSDDLKEKRNVADRTVAVALVGVHRSEDEEMASHRKRENVVPAGGLNPANLAEPVATCDACSRSGMRLERRSPQKA